LSRIDYSMEQSRRAPRYNLEARIEGHAKYGIGARVVDLSSSGALVESSRWFEEGSELSLELTLDGTQLSVKATVVHTANPEQGPCRVGLRFEALPTEQRERIRSFLRRHLETERRSDPRLFVSAPVQLKKEIELTVINLSLYGGLFSVQVPLEFDSEHDFVFTLPEGEVRARGRVRHCEAWARARGAAIFRLGVEFTSLPDADYERVVRYLEDQIQAS
jgi:hypothetical protein